MGDYLARVIVSCTYSEHQCEVSFVLADTQESLMVLIFFWNDCLFNH